MEIKYYQTDDILTIKFNDNPIGREVSLGWNLHVTYDESDIVKEIVLLEASKSGVEEFWFNMAMAAEYTGLSESTLRRKIKMKQLKAYQPGRDYRFRKKDLDQFLKKAKVA